MASEQVLISFTTFTDPTLKTLVLSDDSGSLFGDFSDFGSLFGSLSDSGSFIFGCFWIVFDDLSDSGSLALFLILLRLFSIICLFRFRYGW